VLVLKKEKRLMKVIIHADYGGGFGTNANEERRVKLVTNSTLIFYLERLEKAKSLSEIENYFESFQMKVEEILGRPLSVKISKLKLVEIPDNTRFYITEYDGWESVIHEKMPRPWW
jgi:hypothetical protein